MYQTVLLCFKMPAMLRQWRFFNGFKLNFFKSSASWVNTEDLLNYFIFNQIINGLITL